MGDRKELAELEEGEVPLDWPRQAAPSAGALEIALRDDDALDLDLPVGAGRRRRRRRRGPGPRNP